MTLSAIRRANLSKLLPQYPSQAALARAAGISAQMLSALLVGQSKSFGEKAARTIEQNLGLAVGWLDQGESSEAPALSAGLDDDMILLARRIQALTPRDRDTVLALVDKLEA